MSTHTQRLAEAARIRRDDLAERVANGASIADAGRAIGVSAGMARKLWRRVRDDLGWRAQ